jgi:YHS domain-containing protein
MFFRLIIACVIVYLLYRVGQIFFSPSAKERRRFPGRPASIAGEDLVKDPYCGTYVPESSEFTANIDGETLCFCSKECLEKYKAEKMN